MLIKCWWEIQVLISPSSYEQLLHTKVYFVASLFLQFVFVIFWQKEKGKSAARKMLVELTPEAAAVAFKIRVLCEKNTQMLTKLGVKLAAIVII